VRREKNIFRVEKDTYRLMGRLNEIVSYHLP
jgi:hypothetical protein